MLTNFCVQGTGYRIQGTGYRALHTYLPTCQKRFFLVLWASKHPENMFLGGVNFSTDSNTLPYTLGVCGKVIAGKYIDLSQSIVFCFSFFQKVVNEKNHLKRFY